MSALNYEFLVQPTRMEGKNSYCVVKCVIKCVINEQCNRWSPSFCRAINCFTFDTFLLKICCFAKMDMNRKKRSTAIMSFILNREQKFFILDKKSTVLQILFNCLKCYNATQGHSCTIFRSVGKEIMALGLWSDFWFCFEDIFPGISIQAFSVIYFSVVSDVNLLLLTSCKKLDSVFQVCLLRNFFFL